MRRLPLLLLLTASPALAEDPVVEATVDAQASILLSLDLPTQAHALRLHGVPDVEVKAVVTSARTSHVPAAEVTEVFRQTDRAVRDHGPVDNFGAFVQARLDEGLRGKDLAAAIRTEHEAHGKGKGHGTKQGGGHGKGDGQGHGKAGDHGKPDGKGGRPDGKGGTPAGKGGRPDGKGKH